jgi:HK97 family phage major capsid protein
MDANELLAEVKKQVEPVMTAHEEFKKAVDQQIAEIKKKGSADPILEDKIKKIDAVFDGYERLNQELVKTQRKNADLEDQIANFEAMLARIPGSKGTKADVKALVKPWILGVYNAHTVGVVNLPEEQRKALADVDAQMKALNIGTDTSGGYLAPAEFVAEIIKGITDLSPVRTLARVRTTAAKAVQIPKRTGQFAARRNPEMGAKTETEGLSYGLEEMTAPELYALVDISNEMLEDTGFDIEAEVRGEAAEQFAVKEGAEFVSGTGVESMQGILVNSGVGESISGTAATIADSDGQANGLLTLKYGLKAGYARNAFWLMNRTTMGSVRKLKTSDKQYIWMPGIQNGAPNTIDGDPYVEIPDMPSEGAGLYPIAYGDFRRGYTIVDRIVMEMLRDPYTQAAGGKIRFIFRKRVGGKVTLAEAIRKLKCAAA